MEPCNTWPIEVLNGLLWLPAVASNQLSTA